MAATTPTFEQLDEEHTTTCTYELVVVAPHLSIDEDGRKLLREVFEQCAHLVRMKLEFAAPGRTAQLRATRMSQEHGLLDIFDPAEYPQKTD